MTAPIISVEKLGKSYRRHGKLPRNNTFRDALTHFASAPFTRLRDSLRAPRQEDLFWAIRDISFQVQPGEVIGLIGHNGAGKSTLLKVLSRVTSPTEGRAVLRGRVASLLEVGTGFHPELSGRENIFLNGALLGMRRAEIQRKFDEIVEFSEIGEFLDAPVKHYSSGMYVRLAFAVGAHLEPEILFVDEVLAVGDASFQRKCLSKMMEVVRAGRTILFVSHNMESIISLCPHVMVVERGRVSERMPADEGIKKYLASVHQAGGRSLREAPRLSQRKEPIFTDLSIRSGNGDAGVVEAGGKLIFELELSNFADLRHPRVTITVKSDRQQPIVSFDTRAHSALVFQGAEHLRLSCEVPALGLVPGSYMVDLSIADDERMIEQVEMAERFEVLFSDLYRTGYLPRPAQGAAMFAAAWFSDR
jgi:lipopolysaccharide transport system ATP-binding protein